MSVSRNSVISILNLCIFTTCLCGMSHTSSDDSKNVKPLPHEDMTFQTLIDEGFLYVDKTQFLIDLLNTKRTLLYISRPRRFGKSLFLAMMSTFFCGEQKYFNGLEIGKVGNFPFFSKRFGHLHINTSTADPIWIQFPVIHLDFTKIGYFKTIDKFENEFQLMLKDVANSYHIDYKDNLISIPSLISKLYEKFAQIPVIVLVDEFDSPFQKAVTEYKNVELAKCVKSFLNSFLGQLKASCTHLGIAFITAVSRLPLTMLQSGANNFLDLTFEPVLATAYGLTEREINLYLSDHLEALAKSMSEGSTKNDAFNKLVKHYDGYRFVLHVAEGENVEKVFNPISTLKCLQYRGFNNFWSSTGSMDYVVEQFWMKGGQYRYQQFTQNYAISFTTLTERYDATESPIPLPVWMISYGYATIKDYYPDTGAVHIKFPNQEIADAVYDNMLKFIPSKNQLIHKCTEETRHLHEAFNQGIIQSVIKTLRDFGFFPWSHPSNAPAKSPEITRRLNTIFSASGFNFVEGILFKKDEILKDTGGDIDFLIRNLTIDYIISVNCSNNPEERGFAAMQQLIDYTKNCPDHFWKTVSLHTQNPEETKIYFLSLGFGYEFGGQLCDWAFIPYENKEPLMDEILADTEELKQSLLQYLNSTDATNIDLL